jgi:predicted DNA-binding transcriptional regulator YafY
MGQRSSAETVIAIIQAFLRQRDWSQADLAREIGVGVPALRQRLRELCQAGVPLESQADHPQVFWSLPHGWFPGAIDLNHEEGIELVRLLRRLPKGSSRDRLITKLSACIRKIPSDSPVIAVTRDPQEEQMLCAVEDAAHARVAIRMRYHSLYRGALEWRTVSVQRVLAESPARFVAWCHRSQQLKWFRADRILSITRDNEIIFSNRLADADEFVATSVSGFREMGQPVECSFLVNGPEARWVSQNLPGPLTSAPIGSVAPGGTDSIRVRGLVGSLLPIARFVVGLGDAACSETEALSLLVRELALGAAKSHAISAHYHNTAPLFSGT